MLNTPRTDPGGRISRTGVVFVKFSKKKFGIRIGVVVEKQKVDERGASSMFPPNRGFGGSAPNLLGCLAAFFKID